MYLKSLFPDPINFPATNAHYMFFKRPDQGEWPDFTVHIDLGSTPPKRLMYKEFSKNIEDLSTGLAAPESEGGMGLAGWGENVLPERVGVNGGNELVGILGENSSEYITLVHACIRAAIPFAPISSYSTAFELKHALEVSKVTRLFVDETLLRTVLPVAKQIGLSHDRIYLLKERSGSATPGTTVNKSFWKIIHQLRESARPIAPIHPAGKNTLAYLVFSSGTSGLPKAVMISHGNLIYATGQALAIAAATIEVYTPPALNTPEGIPVTLAFLPLHHSYGLHAYSFRSTFIPNSLIILPKWDINVAIDAISRYKVSNLMLIPSVIHQLVNHPKIKDADLSSISTILTGAAYMPPELGVKFMKFVPGQAKLSEGYGMSEATIGAVMQPHDGMLGGRLKRIPGSVGVLLPGMEARLLKHADALPPSSTEHDTDLDCAFNEEGELWLRSQNIALGYWNNPKANLETFIGGWLRTGDRFRIDENHNFWFADRAKDTLKVSGSQVSPVEIENCLLSHPEGIITDASVAGVSGGRTNDEKVPRAWVVLSEKGRGLGNGKVIKELERWHKENLSKYKWLRGGIEVVDEIPKLPTGKTLRRVLQERHEARMTKSKGWVWGKAKL